MSGHVNLELTHIRLSENIGQSKGQTNRRSHNGIRNLLDTGNRLAHRHGLDKRLEVLRIRRTVARVAVVDPVVGLLAEVYFGSVQLPGGDVLTGGS